MDIVKTQIDRIQIKIEENYTIHEQNLTQHQNKFDRIDQKLQEQSQKDAQLQKRMENLELGNTCLLYTSRCV